MDENILKKERVINRLHLVYGFVILAILGVCLLVIVPGRINQNAFENFCFAATIVSIVLAVVSIVYSFRTKNNASDNMAGIREVERSIDDKLRKFDELEKNILNGLDSHLQNGITPLHDDVSSLHDDQVGIRDSIEQIREEMRQQSLVKTTSGAQENQENKMAAGLAANSFLGNIAIYLACMSFKTHKAINLLSISEKLSLRRDYLFGYLVALYTAYPDSLKIKVEPGVAMIDAEFVKFDSSMFGTEEVCRQRLSSFKDKDVVNEYLDAIDRFFSGE